MFGHMECQSGASEVAEVVKGQKEDGGGRGAFSASSATALNIICYAILRTATSATNCPIGSWPEQQYKEEGRREGDSSTALNGRQIMYTRTREVH